MNNEFKIKKSGFSEIKKRVLLIVIPLVFLPGIIAIIIRLVIVGRSSIETALTTASLYIGFVSFVLFFLTKRQKKQFESIKLVVTENEIIRTQKYTKKKSIFFKEINSVIKTSKGGMIIKGKSASEIIVIPTQIDDFKKLEQILSQILPIQDQTKKEF